AAFLLIALLLGACSDNNAQDSGDNAAPAEQNNAADSSVSSSVDDADDDKAAVYEGDLTGVSQQGADVKVNQVGYLPDARKLAMVEGDGEAAGFRVIDTESRAIVFEGQSTESKLDTNAGERVREIDFSEVQTEG